MKWTTQKATMQLSGDADAYRLQNDEFNSEVAIVGAFLWRGCAPTITMLIAYCYFPPGNK